MAYQINREIWLRGALPGIPALLQPCAHALLQARDEVNFALDGFDEKLLWKRLAGIASVGFHLQHLTGILDRLFTYAKGEQLSQTQLEYLASEGKEFEEENIVEYLINQFNTQVSKSIEQLQNTDEHSLTAFREVGRKKMPSTVIGLLFHAAEHTMRHTGQLIVTVKVLINENNNPQ